MASGPQIPSGISCRNSDTDFEQHCCIMEVEDWKLGFQSFLGSVMLSLQSVTLEIHSLFVLPCPYGDERAEETGLCLPSHTRVCF